MVIGYENDMDGNIGTIQLIWMWETSKDVEYF